MDTKWWCLLIAERGAKGRNAITVAKVLFLTTNVQIVVLFIVKGDTGKRGGLLWMTIMTLIIMYKI